MAEFTLRLVTFHSLEGWGGVVGYFVTCGKVGELSGWAWLTSLGVVFFWSGVVNLLPVPERLPGVGQPVPRALAGKPFPERLHGPLIMIGPVVLLAFAVRLLWVDGRWLWGLALGW